jgi:hypothetical protein
MIVLCFVILMTLGVMVRVMVFNANILPLNNSAYKSVIAYERKVQRAMVNKTATVNKTNNHLSP